MSSLSTGLLQVALPLLATVAQRLITMIISQPIWHLMVMILDITKSQWSLMVLWFNRTSWKKMTVLVWNRLIYLTKAKSLLANIIIKIRVYFFRFPPFFFFFHSESLINNISSSHYKHQYLVFSLIIHWVGSWAIKFSIQALLCDLLLKSRASEINDRI